MKHTKLKICNFLNVTTSVIYFNFAGLQSLKVGLGDGMVARDRLGALAEELSLVPSTHPGWLTTAWNSTFWGSGTLTPRPQRFLYNTQVKIHNLK